MRFTGSVEDSDCPVTIELDFENPIRGIEWRLDALRHHRPDEARKGILGHCPR
jgi:hypothetical protein